VKALFNGAVGAMSKIWLRLKLASIPYQLIVDARIKAVRPALMCGSDCIATFQAGGNVVPTVQALIAAQERHGLRGSACADRLQRKGFWQRFGLSKAGRASSRWGPPK